MRHFLSLCTLTTFLILNACMKDISCYRDMILGTWVEQTYDGQKPITNDRGIFTFDGKTANCHIQRTKTETNVHYNVYCKTLTYEWRYTQEILKFTDTLLRLRVNELVIGDNTVIPAAKEIVYKKVSAENTNANTIKHLWEMTQSSDPAVPPFRIKFDTDDSFLLFLKNEEDEWEEKSDQGGKYGVYDTFLTTSTMGCWDLFFTFAEEGGKEEGKKEEKEKGKVVEQMRWSAILSDHTTKSFVFSVVKP